MPRVRIYEERSAYFMDAELPCVWTSPGDYGDSRRKRVKPETVRAEWHRGPSATEWRIVRLFIIGQYVHSRSSLSLMVHYIDGGRVLRDIPLWLGDLIALASPEVMAA